MAHVISIFSQKGGVGKTTACVNIAYQLALRNYRTLIIDFDPQNNASIMTNVDDGSFGYIDDNENGLRNIGSLLFPYVMTGNSSNFSAMEIKKAIFHPTFTKKERSKNADGKVIIGEWDDVEKPFGFDILPAIGMDLSLCELAFTVPDSYISNHLQASRVLLKSVVSIIENNFNYDYILIDCCPSLGILNMNSLTASNYLIIPTTLDYLAAMGVKKTIDRLDEIRTYVPNFQVLGVVFQAFSERRITDRTIDEIIKDELEGVEVFETQIPETQEAKKVTVEGKILSQKTNNKAARAYSALTDEIIQKINKLEGKN